MPNQLLSIVLFGEGFITGIALTAMLGPVTMTILRYGMQVNRIAGVWAAIGTWVSDLVFIVFTYWLAISLSDWVERPSVRLWIFIVSGCGLLLIGLLMVRSKRKSLFQDSYPASSSYVQAFLSGFFVNSLSPFNLFFWIGAAIFLRVQSENAIWYYGGLMMSLIVGDFAKAWLAPGLTRWIKEKYVYWVQVVAGVLIAMTGVFMIGLGLLE